MKWQQPRFRMTSKPTQTQGLFPSDIWLKAPESPSLWSPGISTARAQWLQSGDVSISGTYQLSVRVWPPPGRAASESPRVSEKLTVPWFTGWRTSLDIFNSHILTSWSSGKKGHKLFQELKCFTRKAHKVKEEVEWNDKAHSLVVMKSPEMLQKQICCCD